MNTINQVVQELEAKYNQARGREVAAKKEQKALLRAINMLRGASSSLNGYTQEPPAQTSESQSAATPIKHQRLPWPKVFETLLSNGPMELYDVVTEAARKQGTIRTRANSGLTYLITAGRVKKRGTKVSWNE